MDIRPVPKQRPPVRGTHAPIRPAPIITIPNWPVRKVAHYDGLYTEAWVVEDHKTMTKFKCLKRGSWT